MKGQKRSVLVISTNADEAGAPRHVETLARHLSGRFFFSFIFGEEGPVASRLRRRGHRVFVVNGLRSTIRPLSDLICLVRICVILGREKPDLVHCHSAKAGFLGRLAAALFRVPSVYTVHGWGWRGFGRLKARFFIWLELGLYKLLRTRYIFVSRSVKDEGHLLLGLSQSSGVVIHNGVDSLAKFECKAGDGLTILMPARVSSAKAHDVLISAFERCGVSDARLVLCGSGVDDPHFKAIAHSIAPTRFVDIEFHGQVSNMDDMYSRADVVALISHFEALPLVVLEAMSCSKAIISSNVGGVGELITDGYSGLLIEGNEVKAISEAIRRSADADFRLELGRNAYRVYSKNFSAQSMASATADVYLSVSE